MFLNPPLARKGILETVVGAATWDTTNKPAGYTATGQEMECVSGGDDDEFAVGAVELVGKVYWEFDNVVGNALNCYPGIVDAVWRSNASDAADLTEHWRDGGGWHNTGRWLYNAANNFSFPGWMDTEDDQSPGTLMFAYDSATGELWVGQNGDWYDNSDAVVAGPGGGSPSAANVTMADMDNAYPAVIVRQLGTIWALRDTAATVTYTIPTGFSAIQ